MLENLSVKFAVSKQLPIAGMHFECAEIGFAKDNVLTLSEKVIIPINVTFIDTNIAKIKVANPDLTYVIMFPTLVSNKTFIGKIKTLPYIGDVLKIELPEFKYVSPNNTVISWQHHEYNNVLCIKKCANNVYLVFTDENMYILMKDNTEKGN